MTDKIVVNPGVSKEEARRLWEDGDWLEVALSACRDISGSAHAFPEDRELAVAVWGALIAVGYASEETPNGKTFVKVLRDTQLAVVRGRPLEYDKEARQLCRERIIGLRWLLDTVSQFMPVKQGSVLDQLRALDEKKTPPSDVGSN